MVNSCVHRVYPARKMAEVLLLHDSVRPHTNVCTTEAITKFGWTVLLHPPYSPDLKPSDFQLFCVFFNTAYNELQMPRHCRTPCASGWREGQHLLLSRDMLLVEGGRRLLTKMETIWKNNCIFKKCWNEGSVTFSHVQVVNSMK
jgi:hypothetical protein